MLIIYQDLDRYGLSLHNNSEDKRYITQN